MLVGRYSLLNASKQPVIWKSAGLSISLQAITLLEVLEVCFIRNHDIKNVALGLIGGPFDTLQQLIISSNIGVRFLLVHKEKKNTSSSQF